jgi:GntR family transcriptional regulator
VIHTKPPVSPAPAPATFAPGPQDGADALPDRSTRLPLYVQIERLLQARIEAGAWRPGEQIPTEAELCELYQVSRITVRRAIAELVQRDYLARYPGRGTFVAGPRIEQRISRLTGFTQDMEARGKQPGARVLQFEVVEMPPLPWAFHLSGTGQAILLKRLRLADGEPLAVEKAYLFYDLCRAIQNENIHNRSLYELLRKKCGLVPTRAVQQWSAVACPKEEAALLGVARGAPALHIYRTTFDQDDRPFEWV